MKNNEVKTGTMQNRFLENNVLAALWANLKTSHTD